MGEMISIRSRKIYAYISEIISLTQDEDGKWALMYDCIWNDNGCPIRDPFNLKRFDTEEEARSKKVGDVIDSRTIYTSCNSY